MIVHRADVACSHAVERSLVEVWRRSKWAIVVFLALILMVASILGPSISV
jgi:hypothetical protein